MVFIASETPTPAAPPPPTESNTEIMSALLMAFISMPLPLIFMPFSARTSVEWAIWL